MAGYGNTFGHTVELDSWALEPLLKTPSSVTCSRALYFVPKRGLVRLVESWWGMGIDLLQASHAGGSLSPPVISCCDTLRGR